MRPVLPLRPRVRPGPIRDIEPGRIAQLKTQTPMLRAMLSAAMRLRHSRGPEL